MQVIDAYGYIANITNENVGVITTFQKRAVEAGLVTLIEPINIIVWNKQYYTDIPQQMDCQSCGVYMIKYMLEWDGDKMLHQFTQEAQFLSEFERDVEGEVHAMDDDVKIIGTGKRKRARKVSKKIHMAVYYKMLTQKTRI
uniref:Ubiquitin-like protease family profile domain-containing protein n=1 Tax=Oryza punctata TaxID=4537 RepID=A0A0E0K2W4_ORYPU